MPVAGVRRFEACQVCPQQPSTKELCLQVEEDRMDDMKFEAQIWIMCPIVANTELLWSYLILLYPGPFSPSKNNRLETL
jgi:hypothetical protein